MVVRVIRALFALCGVYTQPPSPWTVPGIGRMTAQRRDEPKGLGKDEISDSEEEPQTSAYGGHAHARTHALARTHAHA